MMNTTTFSTSSAAAISTEDKMMKKLKRQTTATKIAAVCSLAAIVFALLEGKNVRVFDTLLIITMAIGLGCNIACGLKGFLHILTKTATKIFHMPIFPINFIAAYTITLLVLFAEIFFPIIGTYASLRETKAELAE